MSGFTNLFFGGWVPESRFINQWTFFHRYNCILRNMNTDKIRHMLQVGRIDGVLSVLCSIAPHCDKEMQKQIYQQASRYNGLFHFQESDYVLNLNKISYALYEILEELPVSILSDNSNLEYFTPKFLARQYSVATRDVIPRNTEMMQLEQLLQNGQFVGVTGFPGVGKTTLVAHWIEKVQQEWDYVIWLDIEKDWQMAFCDSMLVMNLNVRPPVHQHDPVAYYRELFMLLLQKLRSLPGKVLFVIDNLPDEYTAAGMLRQINPLPSWKMILISTTRWSEIPCVEVNSISIDEACDLFLRLSGSTDVAACRKIVEAIEGHTLTVELLAKAIRFNRNLSPAKLYELLDLNGLAIDMVDVPVKYSRSKKAKSNLDECLAQCFHMIFDLQEPEVMQFLSLFAALPPVFISLDRMTELLQIGEGERIGLENHLNFLVERGLLVENAGDIKCHTVLREIVLKNFRLPAISYSLLVNALSARLNDFFSPPVVKKQYLPFAESVVHALPADYPNLCAFLCEINDAFDDLKEHAKALRFGLWAIKTHRLTQSADRCELAQALHHVGNTYFLMGDSYYQESVDYVRQALAILEEMGNPRIPLLAWIYHDIGRFYEYAGNVPYALHHHNLAYAVLEELVQQNPQPEWIVDLAIVCNSIGWNYALSNDWERARICIEEAVDLFDEHFSGYNPKMICPLENLATVCLRENNPEEAEKYYRRALELKKDFYGTDHPEYKAAAKKMESFPHNSLSEISGEFSDRI